MTSGEDMTSGKDMVPGNDTASGEDMTSGEDRAEPKSPAGSVPVKATVLTLQGLVVGEGERPVAVEAPLQMAYAEVAFAVMMVTPADLEDFAYGFSLTEGVIDDASEIRGVTLGQAPEGLTCRIDLVGEKLHRHLARQRAMTGRTGCGVCGIDDLDALKRATAAKGAAQPVFIASIERALEALDDGQVLNAATRAVHAAAWANRSGAILHLREDVGRHNALDKLIGALLRAGVDPADGFIVITSRCSFEMVEKASTFGARAIVAISAPTALAIERARSLDLLLVAIARRDTLTVFNGIEKLSLERSEPFIANL